MLRVIERYRRPAFDRLEFESTIEDPKTYRSPWTVKRVATLAPDLDVTENICNAYPLDPLRPVGK